MKTFGIICLVVLGLAALLFGSLELYKYFGPRWEDARTDVYRNNKSYVEGTVRDLRNLQVQYLEAESDEAKAALKHLVLQRADELDWERLPSDVRSFVKEMDRERSRVLEQVKPEKVEPEEQQ